MKDIGWNALTAVPMIGTGAAIGDGIGNAINMATTDNPEVRAQSFRNIASDCISGLPLVGTVSSLGGIGYDILGWGNDTSGNLLNQVMGGKDAYPGYSEEGGNYTP